MLKKGDASKTGSSKDWPLVVFCVLVPCGGGGLLRMTGAHMSRCDWQFVVCSKRHCSELTDRYCQEFRSKVVDLPWLLGCDATLSFGLHPSLHCVVVSSHA